MSPPAPAALPRSALAVVLLSSLLSLWIALRYPLVDPDEGRNAEVAREMAASGDVVIPHLAGMPYLDKPPALFAAAALAIRALGHTPLAARLPSMLAALATLLVLARASSRLEPAGHAVRVTALAAAAPLFAVLSAYVIFDMPLTLCVTVVWTALALERAHGASVARRAGLFAAVTLGLLLKGPVMLAWAIGGSATAALLLRERAPLRWLAWWPGWLLVLGVAGGWFALALRRYPEYARYAFLEESLERLSSGSFKREQPWWFVPAVLAGGALPWSLATPWRAPRSGTSRIAAGFVLFAALFFTLSRSKLVTYLLPAIPALAWWAAESGSRAGAARVRVASAVTAVVWFGFAALAAATDFAAFGTVVAPSSASAALGLALAALGVVALAAVVRPAGVLRWLPLVALAPALLVVGAPTLAEVAHSASGARLAQALRNARAVTVTYEDCYSPGTDFLLGRISRVVSPTGHALTSNYVVRYRETLRRRGQWRLDPPEAGEPSADVVIFDARARSGRESTADALWVGSRLVAIRPPAHDSRP